MRSDLDFTLTAGAVAVGRVLDGQTGEPIPGVSVDLVDVDNPLYSYVSRVIGAPRRPRRIRRRRARSATPAATPGPAGSGQPVEPPARPAEVVIGPVPPGEYSLIVYPGTENDDYVPVELGGEPRGSMALA